MTSRSRPDLVERDLINRRTLAERLGVSERHVANLERLGLPVESYGRRRLYDYGHVRRWAQAQAAEDAARRRDRAAVFDAERTSAAPRRRRRAVPRDDATSAIEDGIRTRIGTKKPMTAPRRTAIESDT